MVARPSARAFDLRTSNRARTDEQLDDIAVHVRRFSASRLTDEQRALLARDRAQKAAQVAPRPVRVNPATGKVLIDITKAPSGMDGFAGPKP
jgi:hypothetical protein